MGPGPSCVPPAVSQALAAPTLGHLDSDFVGIMDEIKLQLAALFKCSSGFNLPISGTGSAGMETTFVNLVEPGDKVLILSNGVFGERMKDVAARLGADVYSIDYEWGTPVEPDDLRKILHDHPFKIVAVVHAETSTGVANPIADLAQIMRGNPALFLVDCVTSLGGMNFDAAAWSIDACYSGTQKCLSCPPGLSPVYFSDRAVKAIQSRKAKPSSWYLDVSMLINYWSGAQRVYHHTAPINMLYGLYAALQLVQDEGLDAVFARHRAAHERLVAGLQTMGLSMFVDPACRLPMLNSIRVPEGVDEAAVRKRLRWVHKIEIGPGLGPLAGKIWRVGLMGHTARPENVERFLNALEQCLES